MATRAQKAAERIFDAMMGGFSQNGLDTLAQLLVAQREGFVTVYARMIEEELGKCAANADENEPTFTLRAKDITAPGLVKMWASLAQREGAPPEKTVDAKLVEAAMVKWQQENPQLVKVPD